MSTTPSFGWGADTVRLRPHQGYTVPKGVRHKTNAPERTVIVMVEPAGVVPTGDRNTPSPQRVL